MILTPREKIINLRKKYKITQEQLSSNNLKRQFIGMIEIGKRGLTAKTAEIISENFNKIFLERNISEKVNSKYFLETEDEQAYKYLNEMIRLREFDFNNLEYYYYKLNFQNQMKMGYLLGKNFFEINNFKLSIKYYQKVLQDINFFTKDVRNEIILNLTRNYYYLEKFEETKTLIEKYYEKFNEINSKDEQKIVYNYSYALYKISDTEKCLKVLNLLLKKESDEELSFKINNLIAIIYYTRKNMFKKALNIYKNIFDELDFENKLVVYGNYIKVWLITKRYIDIEKVILEINKILKDYKTSEYHYFKILILIARSYVILKKMDIAYNYYLKALNIKSNILLREKYKLLLLLFETFSLTEEKIDDLIVIFIEIFSLEKNYEFALKIIKEIKNDKKKLFLLTKI